ncbi:hypothetical protein GTQ48_10610 [Alteromonas genovensis]|uniref:Uncharacterized protein n=1 Tax=Alteromonas genovensis TaxID=471225 RepID=A0A6N9TKB4_9ALTE|nr:hypothetical protein [Alteromonas genovensis]NDW15969.1 hypothetical protein [Alteromonas genovensis]
MNIEQKTNMQELAVEEYTKVYGGHENNVTVPKPIETIFPKHPTPPGGKSISI